MKKLAHSRRSGAWCQQVARQFANGIARRRGVAAIVAAGLVVLFAPSAGAFRPPERAPLPNVDKRPNAAAGPQPSAEQTRAVAELRNRVPKLSVDFEPITGGPKFVSARDGFLSGPNGEGRAISQAAAAAFGKNEAYRATKAFLHEHRKLFGHGPEALDRARVKREFTTPHNGMRTVVWEQQADGIPVFEAVLIAHTTSRGELVNLSSQFVPDPEAAVNRGTPARAAAVLAPVITGTEAVALAARDLGENPETGTVTAVGIAAGVEKAQKFTASFLRGESDGRLVWLPMDRETLRLCWDVILTVRQRSEMYRVLVDAQTGKVILRRCLTEYLSDASYRVFTSDSPSPFSPGHPMPLTNQPPLVSRMLVTLSALDTNASPNGWIDDGVNETRGNNVDAHTDTNADNVPNLPRPAGSPFRVFDFAMDLTTQAPTNYRPASVVSLFYWCNWMHDKLYQLGFTEAAGNFQNTNFGRGGISNDALQADAQDGGDANNANMSVPPDGLSPRMQMYLFTGATPFRDSAFDAEVVLHEYTHGLSNRRVGGGIGLSDLQSQGLGEGWSDWYGLALLSESGDDVNGNYAHGAYVSYQFEAADFWQNYYFGTRRYPYSTDLIKNPLTFKDIDPGQASVHPGVPISPIWGFGYPAEVHNQGEVWCVTLWEARANLIAKHGFATGNLLILQLVTDGMNLSPPNPTFVQARDAIIQADLVVTGGANRNELWAAFAKRGLGAHATSPSSFTTFGVHESFDVPDNLYVIPDAGFATCGPVGGPFSPGLFGITLSNAGAWAVNWTLGNRPAWLNVLPAGNTLAPGGSAVVSVSVDASATDLPMGIYSATLWFTNLNSGVAAGRHFVLRVGQMQHLNSSVIRIWDDDVASPYPSTIDVCGFAGTVTNVGVTLFNLYHTFAADISILLVGPAGQTVVVMSAAGGGSELKDVTLSFDDRAQESLPTGQIVTGTFKPTSYGTPFFHSPAPQGPYSSVLATFNGRDPNGTWRLFVEDVEEEDAGAIAGGWSLTINGLGTSVSPLCGTFGTWVSRASRTTNALNDVTFGNGRFVAVGANFNIATSTSGVVWTNQFLGGGFPLNGVTFGNGLFVAVGVGGYVRTSTNGTVWSSPFAVSSAHLNSVAWGNGAFVAVGTNGTILTSPNGTNWTPRFALTNALGGITYGNGRFVAVGTRGAALVSTNGGTNWNWIPGGIGTPANLTDASFGNGQFVAIGPSGTLFTSFDGLAWTARDSGTRADLAGITFGGGRFVAVGNAGDADGLTTSPDGFSWYTYPLPRTALWNDVVFGSSNFVVVGQGGAILQSGQRPYVLGQPQNRIVCATEPVSFTFGVESGCPLAFQWQLNGTNLPGATRSNLSIAAARVEDAGAYTAVATDGIDTLVSSPATLQVELCRPLDQWTQRAPPPGSNALNGVVCAPNSLVAVGNAGTILRSADKMSWLASPAGTNVTISAVAHGGGTFVAVGFKGVILTSSNAIDWTLRDSGTNRILRNIAHGGGRFVAVGDFGTVLSSPDGLAWIAQDLGTNRTLLGLTWANDQFIAVGPGGYIATSPDGAKWTSHASGVTLTLYDVAYGNGRFVAVGNVGSITISTNGIDWIRQTPPATNRLHAVTWANGTFVAVGVAGLVLSSPDGISWSVRNSRTTQDLNAIAYCGNAFVAVGANGTILVSGLSVPPMLSGHSASDHFELNLTAEMGLNYRVQASPSLPATNWLDLFSFTSSWPVTTLRDSTATNAPQRFYRVVSP